MAKAAPATVRKKEAKAKTPKPRRRMSLKTLAAKLMALTSQERRMLDKILEDLWDAEALSRIKAAEKRKGRRVKVNLVHKGRSQ